MLEIKNLTKTYPNGKKAVSNLSMTIEDGDLFGFIGYRVSDNEFRPYFCSDLNLY